MQATAGSRRIRDDSADTIQSRVSLSVTVGPLSTPPPATMADQPLTPAWEGLGATHTQLPATHTPLKRSTGEVTHPEGLPGGAGCRNARPAFAGGTSLAVPWGAVHPGRAGS